MDASPSMHRRGPAENPDAPAAAGLAQTTATEPDAALERAQNRRQVQLAVAALSPTQRETVTLYYLTGLRVGLRGDS